MAYQEAKNKTFIRVTSEFTAGGIQMNILIYTSTHPNSGAIGHMSGRLVKDARRLNDFLDRHIDAQPFDGDCYDVDTGERTKRFIKEIREYREVGK